MTPETAVTSAKDQKTLPGMEQRDIADLEKKAHEYAKIRDKRMDLTRRETELQSDLLGLLKKHKKREYKRDGIEIQLITEKEKVKVKITQETER